MRATVRRPSRGSNGAFLLACVAATVEQQAMAVPSNSYKLSRTPLASSPPAGAEGEPELPVSYGKPLLLAIARNRHTLFVCWSVDWPAAFGDDFPADRKAHLKLRCGEIERTQSVEPLMGSCSIGGLEAGQTYLVELGYFGRGKNWHAVVPAQELMMPLSASPDETESVNVATVPFHLSFLRLIEIFGGEATNVVSKLGEVEAQAAQRLPLEEELLHALGIPAEGLGIAESLRQRLARMKRPAPEKQRFGVSSSPVHFSPEPEHSF